MRKGGNNSIRYGKYYQESASQEKTIWYFKSSDKEMGLMTTPEHELVEIKIVENQVDDKPEHSDKNNLIKKAVIRDDRKSSTISAIPVYNDN